MAEEGWRSWFGFGGKSRDEDRYYSSARGGSYGGPSREWERDRAYHTSSSYPTYTSGSYYDRPRGYDYAAGERGERGGYGYTTTGAAANRGYGSYNERDYPSRWEGRTSYDRGDDYGATSSFPVTGTGYRGGSYTDRHSSRYYSPGEHYSGGYSRDLIDYDDYKRPGYSGYQGEDRGYSSYDRPRYGLGYGGSGQREGHGERVYSSTTYNRPSGSPYRY